MIKKGLHTLWGVWGVVATLITPVWLTLTYLNISGEIYKYDYTMDEGTAIVLGIVMAIISSYKNHPIAEGMIVFGEVGLSGEVRAVSMPEQRVAEAKKLGFETCILPEVCMKTVKDVKGIKLLGVKSVNEAVAIF